MSDRRFRVCETRGIEYAHLSEGHFVFRLAATIVGKPKIDAEHNMLRLN
jgi:hypothetical protein